MIKIGIIKYRFLINIFNVFDTFIIINGRNKKKNMHKIQKILWTNIMIKGQEGVQECMKEGKLKMNYDMLICYFIFKV